MSYFYVKCRDRNLNIQYLRRATLKLAFRTRDDDCPFHHWQCLEIRDSENRIIWQAGYQHKERNDE